VRTLDDWIEGEVCEEDEVSSLCVCEHEVERLVGLLMPVGQLERHVECRRTQYEQVVAQQLLGVFSTVDRQTDVAGTAAQTT